MPSKKYPAPTPVQLSLHLETFLLYKDEAGLRCWEVFIQTRLNGAPVDFPFVAVHLDVWGEGLDAEYQGLVADASTVLYRLWELGNPGQATGPLQVSLLPKYSPRMELYYKIDPLLAELVEVNYLQKPKYCLTRVHGYADYRDLKPKETYIVCDQYLTDLLGVRLIKCKDLWARIHRHITPFRPTLLEATINLDGPKTDITRSLDLLRDHERYLYPADANSCNVFPAAAGRSIVRTQSVRPAAKSLVPAGIQARNARTLQRHKTMSF